MIAFENVSVHDAASATTLLADVSFTIATGEKAVFYGKSGAGKSSVLMTLLGVHTPASGSVRFNETVVDEKTIACVRQSIAFIGQEPVLGANRVRDALLLPFAYKANSANVPHEAAITRALASVHLERSILAKEGSVVSGGEKQRLAIARALLLGKRVFVLDEVTSALDPESKRAIITLFHDAAYTVLSVSHDNEWYALCDVCYKMEAGRIVHVANHPE